MNRKTLPQQHRAKTGAFGYVVPIASVLCWASGFVVPRAFQPHSEPLIFVTLRNAGAFAVLALIALVLRASLTWNSTLNWLAAFSNAISKTAHTRNEAPSEVGPDRCPAIGAQAEVRHNRGRG